jgi:hypothetical protein
MRKMMYITALCVFAGLVPARLQAQTASSGNAVSMPATPAQKQQELAETRKRLAELQAALKSSQVSVSRTRGASSNSRSSGYGMMGSSSTSSRGTRRSGRGGAVVYGSDPFHAWPGSSLGSENTLIVPAQGAGPEDIMNAQDDLQVMSRLFQKQLEQTGIAPPMMGDLFSNYGMDMYGGGQPVPSVQSLYLAGYGTVFQLQIDFPLVALAEDQDEQVASKEDSVWAQTRLELLDPEAARRVREKDKKELPSYDPEKVEGLKATLTKALKYARNIRALQPNEKAVIVVTSTADLAESAPMPYYTTLVMSAGKADIDQFAGGDMTLEQFQKKVQTMMY